MKNYLVLLNLLSIMRGSVQNKYMPILIIVGLLCVNAIAPTMSGTPTIDGPVIPIGPDIVTIAVYTPSNEATVSGIVNIHGTAFGTNMTSVMIKIDIVENWMNATIANVPPFTIDNNSLNRLNYDFSYSWDTTNISNGNHTITIKAIGESGTNETTVSVNVDNSAIGGASNENHAWLFGTGVLIAIGFASVIFVVRKAVARRAKQPTTEPGVSEPGSGPEHCQGREELRLV